MQKLIHIFVFIFINMNLINHTITMEDKTFLAEDNLESKLIKSWEGAVLNMSPIMLNDNLRFWTSGFDFKKNWILASSFNSEEEAIGIILDLKEKAKELGGLTEWWITPSTKPANMSNLLERAGFTSMGFLTLLVSYFDKEFNDHTKNDEIHIQRFTDPDEVATWEGILVEAFNKPNPTEKYLNFLKSDLENENKEYYVGYYKDQLVATGCVLIVDDYAYLYNGAVHSNFREKGIGKKMINKVMTHLKELGLKYVITVTGTDSESRKMAGKLGFKKLFDFERFKISF